MLSSILYSVSSLVFTEASVDNPDDIHNICDACDAGTGGSACDDSNIQWSCAFQLNPCDQLNECKPNGYSGTGYNSPGCCDPWIFNSCGVAFNGDLKCDPVSHKKADICSICASGNGGSGCCDPELKAYCSFAPENVCDLLDKCGGFSDVHSPVCCDQWLAMSCSSDISEGVIFYGDCVACPAAQSSLASSSVTTDGLYSTNTVSSDSASTSSSTLSTTSYYTSSTSSADLTSTTPTTRSESSESTSTVDRASTTLSTTDEYSDSTSSVATLTSSSSKEFKSESTIQSPQSSAEETIVHLSTIVSTYSMISSITQDNISTVKSVLVSAAPSSVSNLYNSSWTSSPDQTVTAETDTYVTYCDEPTTLTWGGFTYDIIRPTTLTLTSCPNGCEPTVLSEPLDSTDLTSHYPETNSSVWSGSASVVAQPTALTIPSYSDEPVEEDFTTTLEETVFTTYCPEPTTFTQGNSVYTVTEATTLTITLCLESIDASSDNSFSTTESPEYTVTTVPEDSLLASVISEPTISAVIPPVVNMAPQTDKVHLFVAIALGIAALI